MPDRDERYAGLDRGNMVRFSHGAIDAGADAVVGFGSHILRAVENYRGRLIAYSIGNFCATGGLRTEGLRRFTVVLKLRIPAASPPPALEWSFAPMIFDAAGRPIPDRESGALDLLRKLTDRYYAKWAARPTDIRIADDGTIDFVVSENRLK